MTIANQMLDLAKRVVELEAQRNYYRSQLGNVLATLTTPINIARLRGGDQDAIETLVKLATYWQEAYVKRCEAEDRIEAALIAAGVCHECAARRHCGRSRD